MPIRNIATIAVALFLGLIAVFLVRNYLAGAGQGGAPVANIGTAPVVVAAQPVARGVVLQPALLKIVNFPQDSVPAGAFQSIAQLTGAKDVQRLALRSLVPNEPILPGKISEPGGKLNLSDAINDGMRAVSLRSNDVAGVGGFVLPGDRVDVMLTRTVGTDQANTITQVLAENVRVLGVDQSNNDEADKPVVTKSVTIEVTPDQAQTISLGQSVGTVSLALRRVADLAKLTRRATSVAELGVDLPRRPAAPSAVRAPARVPAALPPPPETEVRVIRGVDTSLYRGGDTSLSPVSLLGGAVSTAIGSATTTVAGARVAAPPGQ